MHCMPWDLCCRFEMRRQEESYGLWLNNAGEIHAVSVRFLSVFRKREEAAVLFALHWVLWQEAGIKYE